MEICTRNWCELIRYAFDSNDQERLTTHNSTKENRTFRLSQKIGLVLIFLIVLTIACLWLFGSPDGKLLQEQILGKTPQAKVKSYVQMIVRGDQTSALNLWELPKLSNPEQLNALADRRIQITSQLLATKINPAFVILHVEWWGTCCDPDVSDNSRYAGGARMRVQFLDKNDMPLIYIFDVFVRDLPYWGSAISSPLRQWVIRDIYPEGQEPFYWRLISKTTVEFLEWKPTPTP